MDYRKEKNLTKTTVETTQPISKNIALIPWQNCSTQSWVINIAHNTQDTSETPTSNCGSSHVCKACLMSTVQISKRFTQYLSPVRSKNLTFFNDNECFFQQQYPNQLISLIRPLFWSGFLTYVPYVRECHFILTFLVSDTTPKTTYQAPSEMSDASTNNFRVRVLFQTKRQNIFS